MNFFLLLSSFFAALISAMGMGGGGILIVYLTVFANIEQIKAQGINLAFFIPIAILSIIVHSKNKLIEYKRISFIIIGGIIGVFIGAFLSNKIPSNIISKIFALTLLFLGIKELFVKKTN